jgi:hypothetical protein
MVPSSLSNSRCTPPVLEAKPFHVKSSRAIGKVLLAKVAPALVELTVIFK